MPGAVDVMDALEQILKQYWGYDRFRPLQKEIMQSVLDGRDTLALMPTGGGKSLCYQVPALARPGLCLVISPLIALMKDQVENLRKRNITAYSLFSGMNRKEVIITLQTVTDSNCKFLYVSPERLETALFKEYLPGMGVSLLAVDEAHCISQWGYDFRPPYLRIAALRPELPHVPVLALTASATPDVQDDICKRLQFEQPAIFRQSFERPNLSYSAFRVESRIAKITEVFRKVNGTGIVYCRSRKRTKEISGLLQLQGIAADFYHAGLNQEERNKKQEDWIQNRTRVMVCTNAFGMGIDKPDVRTVVHADVPDCLENYYQEAGRAGRDGKNSYAVLLYSNAELKDLETSIDARFPPLGDIREVYQAVCNYLQLPAGAGEGVYYDFELQDFVKKFALPVLKVSNALKVLEQDGWMSFNEQVFLPATAVFTATREHLQQFEKHHPQLEPVIKSLLRAYGGIFDHPVAITETQLASLVRTSADIIKQQLQQLDTAHIIDYQPRKDKPQLVLLKKRVRVEELHIDMAAYRERKEKFIARVKEMVAYIEDGDQCRSRRIGTYFGDAKMQDCGICDNCLRKKPATVTKAEYEKIHQRIREITQGNRIPVRELLDRLREFRKEKAWQVIESLISEHRLKLDDNGSVCVSD